MHSDEETVFQEAGHLLELLSLRYSSLCRELRLLIGVAISGSTVICFRWMFGRLIIFGFFSWSARGPALKSVLILIASLSANYGVQIEYVDRGDFFLYLGAGNRDGLSQSAFSNCGVSSRAWRYDSNRPKRKIPKSKDQSRLATSNRAINR